MNRKRRRVACKQCSLAPLLSLAWWISFGNIVRQSEAKTEKYYGWWRSKEASIHGFIFTNSLYLFNLVCLIKTSQKTIWPTIILRTVSFNCFLRNWLLVIGHYYISVGRICFQMAKSERLFELKRKSEELLEFRKWVHGGTE